MAEFNETEQQIVNLNNAAQALFQGLPNVTAEERYDFSLLTVKLFNLVIYQVKKRDKSDKLLWHDVKDYIVQRGD